GVAAIALWNFSRYGRLKAIGEALVMRGFAGIVTNGGGPAAIAPPGGKDPILGTNPFCLAIPGDPPFFADLATSERPWGAIRESLLSGRPLPPNTFLDLEGKFTDDPECVAAVIPFGGWKGFALATALELLTGALVAGRVGTEVESQLDLGAWIIALKADVFRSLGDISKSVSSLQMQILHALPAEGRRDLSTPDTVEIDDDLHVRLKQMAEGRSFAGYSTNLTD
ncbi:MAG: Ldh family oxidoreductase, partial [Nitrospira sp.]